MTEPRILIVPTIDRGPVRLVCPAWCVEPHETAEYAVDLNHSGPDHPVGPADEPLFVALLSQHPCGSGSHKTGLYVDTAYEPRTMTPAEVDQLAAGLVEAAGQLRHLARHLATVLAAEGRAL